MKTSLSLLPTVGHATTTTAACTQLGGSIFVDNNASLLNLSRREKKDLQQYKICLPPPRRPPVCPPSPSTAARCGKKRRPTVRRGTTTTAALSAEEKIPSVRGGYFAGLESTAVEAATLYAVAARNVLLALTNQHLVLGLGSTTAAGRRASPAAASQGGDDAFLDLYDDNSDDVDPVNGEPLAVSITRSMDSVRAQPPPAAAEAAEGRPAKAAGAGTAGAALNRDSAELQRNQHRPYVGRRRHSSRCSNSSDDMGSFQEPPTTRAGGPDHAGRKTRRSSSPPGAFVLAPWSLAESPAEAEDRNSKSPFGRGERWQPPLLPEGTEEEEGQEGEGLAEVGGGSSMGGARGVPQEGMEGRQGEVLDHRPAGRRKAVKNSPSTNSHGGSTGIGDVGVVNDDAQHQAEILQPQKSRNPGGGWGGGTGRAGGFAVKSSWDAAAAAAAGGMDRRRHGGRRSGVDEV